MRKLTVLIGLSLLLHGTVVQAQVSEEELQALRDQIQMLTKRLDQLEQQSVQSQPQAAPAPAAVDQEATAKVEQLDQEVETLGEQVAAMSWAERIRWEGDFRYRYENIDEEGKDGRNRSRIRARTHLEADLSPTLQVGIGLATGGDDPVSSNQTIGGGGSSKDIKLDLVAERLRGETATFDIKVKSKVIVDEGRRVTARHIRELDKAGVKSLVVPEDYLMGKVLAHNIIDKETGELIASANDEITEPVHLCAGMVERWDAEKIVFPGLAVVAVFDVAGKFQIAVREQGRFRRSGRTRREIQRRIVA